MAVKYIATCAQLPADAPVGSPHIIDLEGIDYDAVESKLRIPDLVATVCLNNSPKTLKRFMDFSRIFKYHYHFKKQGTFLDFCIIREKNIVTVELSTKP